MTGRPKGAGKDSFSLIDADALFAELGLGAGGLFLDLACGPGRYSLEAARRFPALQVQALDLDPDLAATLRRQAGDAGLANLRAGVADITAPLPLGEGTVDACLLAMVVHDLVADRADKAVLSEVQRVLKPGGVLAVIEFHKFPPPPGPPMEVRLEPAELDAALKRGGFRRERTIEFAGKAYLSIFRPAGFLNADAGPTDVIQ